MVNQIIPELVCFSRLPADKRFLHVLYSRSKLPFSSSVVVISQIFLVRQGLQGDQGIPPELLLPIVFYLLPGHYQEYSLTVNARMQRLNVPRVLVLCMNYSHFPLSWLTSSSKK